MPSIAVDTPVGMLTLVEADGKLACIRWDAPSDNCMTALLAEAARQLAGYFAGSRQRFELPLVAAPTPSARATRSAISAIPYGVTVTYGALAAATASSARAVGQGCSANPLPIIVPCHRVLPARGFGHYSGGKGTPTKAWLLAHEGAALI